MFGFTKKKLKQGPPGPRPTPRPRSDFDGTRQHLTAKDIADSNPQLKDIHFGPDIEGAIWDDEALDVKWLGTFSLFSGELRGLFLYRHAEYVVRITDFSGTLTGLFEVAQKAQRAVIADVDHLTAAATGHGDIQFRIEYEKVTITVFRKPIQNLIGDPRE